jgi:hypothetical protein
MREAIDLEDPLVETILKVAHIFPWHGSIVPYVSHADVRGEYSPRLLKELSQSPIYGRLFACVGKRSSELLDGVVNCQSKGRETTYEAFLSQLDPTLLRPRGAFSAALRSMRGNFGGSANGNISIVPELDLISRLVWFNERPYNLKHVQNKLFPRPR